MKELKSAHTTAHWILLLSLVAYSAAATRSASYSLVVPNNAIRGSVLRAIIYTYRPVRSVSISVTDSSGKLIQSSSLTPNRNGVTPININVGLNWAQGSYTLKAVASDYSFNASTYFEVIQKSHSILVQTDKAIYKPSQTVNIRVLVTTADLKPFNSSVTVTVEDSNGHRIIQWVNQALTLGVASFSLPLSDRPALGNWHIKIVAGDESAIQAFEVSEYVLPRFSVSVSLPSYLTSRQTYVYGYVSALYTYGEAVQGVAVVTFQLNGKLLKRSFSIAGNQSFVLGPGDLLTLGLASATYGTLTATANVTESLTGITMSSSTSLDISPFDAQVSFLPATSSYFKKGLSYIAYVKVAHPDGSLLGEPNIRLRIAAYYNTYDALPAFKRIVSYTQSVHVIYNASVPVSQYGIVAVTIPVPMNGTDSFIISAKLLYKEQTIEATKYVSSFRVIGKNDIEVKLVGSAESLKSGDQVTLAVRIIQPTSTYYYMAIARNRIVSYGSVRGTARTFSLTLNAQHAPQTTFLVYVLGSDNEIVADSVTVNVAGAFSNQVTLAFRDTQGNAVPEAKPGDNLTLHVQSDPWSLVGLLSVDQSVLLLKDGNDITQAQLLQELQSYSSDYYPGQPFFFDFFWPRWGGSSSEQIFTDAKLTITTDATIARDFILYDGVAGPGAVRPVAFERLAGPAGQEGPAGRPGPAGDAGTSASSQVRTRKLFPETWIWSLLPLNSTGRGSIGVSAPDTITSWVTTAFSMNAKSGLAVTPVANKFKVFQNFFVSAILPYSVVRGEEVDLNVVVFNYLQTSQVVTITLLSSLDYRAKLEGAYSSSTGRDLSATVTVAAESGSNVHFWIVPQTLGQVKINVAAQAPNGADRIENTLLVKPEGVPQSYCVWDFAILQSTGVYNHTFTVQYPPAIVSGSAKVDISVSGDVMGPSIQGLESLVQVPSGCGEQNMITFTPIIFVREYLEAIGSLDPVLLTKTQNYMLIGYQGQLSYLRNDGFFSAFGNSDEQGSTWLTAFVVKSFRQAQRYINSSIDENVLSNARDKILRERYLANGTFVEKGRVIHVDMQGGSGSGLPLTAYVVIALLEDNLQASTTLVSLTATVSLFESSLASISNDAYALAIVTYALQLAGSSKVSQALTLLEKLAIVSGDTVHWSKGSRNQRPTCFYCPPPEGASAVEMTSYALLTYVKRADLVQASQVAKWLTSQRNSVGGYTSTQDTVLGLQALAAYARLVRPVNFSLRLSFSANNYDILPNVIINSENSLIQQVLSVEHPDTLRTLAYSAVGQGSAIVSVCVSYNIFNVSAEPEVDARVTVTTATTSSPFVVVEVCGRSNKLGGASNGMGLIEVQLPSGYTVEAGGVRGKGVRRVDYEDTKVAVYFDEFGNSWTCATVSMQQSFKVNSVKNAYVKVYNYYNPGQYKVVTYNPLVAGATN